MNENEYKTANTEKEGKKTEREQERKKYRK